MKDNVLGSQIPVLVYPPQPFFLTGSRYFGTATVYSDWDYFTKDTESIRGWLSSQGFSKLPRHSYLDKGTVEVWHANLHGMEIDVQLCLDVMAKRVIQDLMLKSTIFPNAVHSKLAMRALWDLLSEVYYAGKELK